MNNNERSKKIFSDIWSSIYKTIGGETAFKNKFEFIEGTQEAAKRRDGKITVEFINCNKLGIKNGHIHTYGQTRYLRGKPKLVKLMKAEESDERLYLDLIHNYAHEMIHVASAQCQKNLNNERNNNRE